MVKYAVFVVIGIVIGALFMSIISLEDGEEQVASKESVQDQSHHQMSEAGSQQGMTMDDMVQILKDKSGDEYDKAFLIEMISHHEGAIEMAKMSQKQAKHEELRELSNTIMLTQEAEVKMMKEWQKEWGY